MGEGCFMGLVDFLGDLFTSTLRIGDFAGEQSNSSIWSTLTLPGNAAGKSTFFAAGFITPAGSAGVRDELQPTPADPCCSLRSSFVCLGRDRTTPVLPAESTPGRDGLLPPVGRTDTGRSCLLCMEKVPLLLGVVGSVSWFLLATLGQDLLDSTVGPSNSWSKILESPNVVSFLTAIPLF